MNTFKNYYLLFISGLILITSLLLLVFFGMTAIVVVLLVLGVLGCLVSSFVYLLGKTQNFACPKESKKQNSDRPTLLTAEQTYELKTDYVQPEEEKPLKRKKKESAPKTKKEKSVTKRPSLKAEENFAPKTKEKTLKEESTPKKTCPKCKYKNYSTESFCQNCGAKLK